MNGFLCINKPCGPSSFNIISQVRRSLRIKKVGHAGTLDPYASGLLVIALGSATRLLRFLPGEPKVYRFTIQFGMQTDTFDSEGSITVSGKSIPQCSMLNKAVQEFIGEREQIPPNFSAVKVGGVRAYKLARRGEEFTLKPRPVKIFSFQTINYDEASGCGQFELSCSGGTYVRALVRDLASHLGTCGYATSIERISAGCFSIEQALDCKDLDKAAKYIIAPADVFCDFPSVQIDGRQKELILNGVDIKVMNMDSEWVFAYVGDHLLAVLHAKGDSSYHPLTVLSGTRVD